MELSKLYQIYKDYGFKLTYIYHYFIYNCDEL